MRSLNPGVKIKKIMEIKNKSENKKRPGKKKRRGLGVATPCCCIARPHRLACCAGIGRRSS